MKDFYGREIEYIRISITDRCNLRCAYCMPNGIDCVPMSEILTFEEITDICCAAADIGIKYVRLTGGEPLVRLGCEKLVKMIKDINGIEKVSITTNGILLEDKMSELIDAGLDGVNISLDTLDNEKFKHITGFYGFEKVLSAIDHAYSRGLSVKINAVILDCNINEVERIALLAQNRNIAVRFIEMMPIGEGAKFHTINCDRVMTLLQEGHAGIRIYDRKLGLGPAVYYDIPGFKGKVGFINAVHGKFCDSCNRVRLTSTGFLKSCLCYNVGTDLKEILRHGDKSSLKAVMERTIFNKPKEHCFDQAGEITEGNNMYKIGG